MKRLLVVNICFIFISCSFNSKNNSNGNSFSTIVRDSVFDYENVCELSENLGLLSNISSFCFVDSSLFVVSTTKPSKLFIYDISGKQIAKIGNNGRGPNEYLNISLVKTYNEKIYVWCDKQLKLIVFNKKGVPLKEYKNFNKAIRDFIPYENDVYFYLAGGIENGLIEIYNLNQEKSKGKYYNPSNEHNLLGILKYSGGMTIHNNKLLFSSADKLVINSLDLLSSEMIDFNFRDVDFKVTKVENDSRQIVNRKRNKVFEYINNNSVVTGLYSLSNNILLTTEIGYYIKEGKRLSNKNRYKKWFVISNNMHIKYAIQVKQEWDLDSSLIYEYNGDLYMIILKIKKEEMYYYLVKYKGINEFK